MPTNEKENLSAENQAVETADPEMDEMLAANSSSAEEALHQTESEAPSDVPETNQDTDEGAQNTDSPQTETEPVKKPKRRKKSSGSEATNAESQSESDTEPVPEQVDDVNSVPEKPKKKRATAKSKQTVISIDEQRTVETEADKAKNDLLDLIESLKTGRILSGTIQGVERASDKTGRTLAVIYHGDFKIIIPAEEAVEPPSDYRDQNPDDVHHYMLTKRLGAEVDFIIKGIDPEAKIAVASRLDAMKAKRKQYYLGSDHDGNYHLYAGICAEARVVSVIRAGIFVDLFGLEIYIPLRELSYQRMMDASSYYQPGQRILVKVLSVDRSDRNNLKATASVKQATENPYEKALRRYSVDNRYVGTVSMVDTNGVFVALDGGIDCLCSYPKRGRPPRGARVTVRILGINHETNRIWGAITHIAAPR